ncbi:hypothetical protein BDM02DRAFT_3119237 [Thelephora ganbajun]|uniref:Uncharacterized protein n=1 Tax=Thelephora ganbajun TaxID=370292 RepID=A0ACB6Z9L7_THEGA|nr:hypothetical protein BDM02DRAFT_3119237 [Thelephora ganbajun]
MSPPLSANFQAYECVRGWQHHGSGGFDDDAWGTAFLAFVHREKRAKVAHCPRVRVQHFGTLVQRALIQQWLIQACPRNQYEPLAAHIATGGSWFTL